MGFPRATGDELDLLIGVTSMLSSNPDALAGWLAVEGTTSKDEPSTASPSGLEGCTRDDPLLGEAEEAAGHFCSVVLKSSELWQFWDTGPFRVRDLTSC